MNKQEQIKLFGLKARLEWLQDNHRGEISNIAIEDISKQITLLKLGNVKTVL